MPHHHGFEFVIGHSGSTVPERSGVALSFCGRPDKTRISCEKFAKAAKAANFKHRRLNRAFALEGHGGASTQGLQLKLSALSRSTREGNFLPSRRLKLT
ncbi:hypothetical protein [Pseudomonas putida]|uniref:hypothetical protein n=1 Tax=Pseudomonas putida TaxID=303 RepID=UPI000CD48620|nr:hypothetical protein [Pseudomonas putida]